MLRLEVTADDLARTRFAVSPAFELDFRLRSAQVRNSAAFAELRRTSELDLVLALQSARYGADFTTPIAPIAPNGTPDIAADLDLVRRTPADVAAAEIHASLARQRGPVDDRTRRTLARPDAAARIADALAAAWAVLLAPHWARVRVAGERDILHRGEHLRRSGWAGVLGSLHGDVRWRRGHLELDRRGAAGTVASAGAGLLLVPTALGRRRVAAHTSTHHPRAVVYPARLLYDRELHESGHRQQLGDLLGPTRADVLLALGAPATTSQLARELQLAVGSVGDHLAVLRRAGLVGRTRTGRTVEYRRTAAGDTVVRAPARGAQAGAPR